MALHARLPAQPRPQFVVEQCSEAVPPDLREQIVKTMMWEAQFALYDTVTPGRSLYALMRFEKDGQRMMAPIKLKGAGGLKRESPEGGGLLVPPEPHLRYSPARQLHFAMGTDYELGAVLGTEKSKYSCSVSGGRNEYAIQQKAYEHGISLPPLLQGRFDGETDRNGNPTGGVALAADPSYQTVGRANSFRLEQHKGELLTFLVKGEKILCTPIAIAAAINCSTVEMMGEVKRKALVELGISRHAGHEGNFLLNEKRDHMLIADFDSAKELSALDADVRPFQLLRDVSHDTWRAMTKFALKFQMHDEALAALQDNQSNPVHRFLTGFFGKTVSQNAIDAESQWLTQQFLAFARAHQREVGTTLADHVERPDDLSQSLFQKELYPLFADCIIACTRLMQADDDVRARGYVLPPIAEADLRAKADRGIETFFLMADAESERAYKVMQADGLKVDAYF